MENKTKKFRFNIIDFLIIIAAIAIIVVVLFRNGIIDKFSENTHTITYTARVSDIQEESFDYFQKGDIIYSNDDNRVMGKILDVKKQKSEIYLALADGSIVKKEQPGRIDVELLIETEGTVTDDGCRIDGVYFIAAAKTFGCYNDKLFFNVEVLKVDSKLYE